MNWTELLKSEIEELYPGADNLMAMTEGLPLDWKPEQGDNWMTTGQLLMHLANGCGAGMKGFVTGDWGMPDGVDLENLPAEEMLPPAERLPAVESVAEARRILAEDKKVALETLDQAGEERIASETVKAPWDPRPALLGKQLLMMTAHLNSHKHQLFYYLKLQGKPVNTSHLWHGGEK